MLVAKVILVQNRPEVKLEMSKVCTSSTLCYADAKHNIRLFKVIG